MEFDKSRVYTALNADELKVGSKIILADNLSFLKERVTHDAEYVTTLANVRREDYASRFIGADNGAAYTLAYLVSEPEKKKLKWTDLKRGDWIKEKGGSIERMVVAINTDETVLTHICAAGSWLADTYLVEWEKVEDEAE